MILFETIRWKNFLSTGNQFTEINLDKDQTTLIIGNNGAGKSTILDALCFSLFGKSFRKINKPQLVNSTNEKDCVVEIEFKIGNTDWKVRRGIKPALFEIYRNDTKLDQSSSANDQQKWFEQTVLKMNYKSFTQIVILGSSNFVPFMQLSSANRREVIEDLLDIKIFTSMNNLIKDKIRQSKEDIRVYQLKKDSLADKVKMQENFIDELENRAKQNIVDKEEKIGQLLVEENNWMGANEEKNRELVDLQKNIEKYSGATEKLRTLGNLKGKISNKVSTITKEHKFFAEHTVCPTCNQDIEETFRINRIDDAQSKAKELQSGYIQLEEAIKEEEERERHFINLSKEITSLTHGISQNNIKITGCQRQIRDLESEIQRVTDQLANRTAENEKLESFKQKLNTTYEELAQRRDTINHYDYAYGLLKDGGVKSQIIKKYLPLINQQVNRYLQMMDFYINFTLDEEFNETVQSPIHEDFSYKALSVKVKNKESTLHCCSLGEK